MIIKNQILLFLVFLFSSLFLQAETTNEPFSEVLPSQQTQQEIQNMSENLYDENAPQLRARPGDISGSDQGQKVPVGDAGFIEFMILLISLLVYGIFLKYRKNRKLMLSLTFAVAGFATTNAQIKAVTDNYFIEPGKTSYIYVVTNDDPGSCSEFVGDLELTILSNPAAGVTLLQNPDDPQEIRVRATAAAHGQYSFTYKITCKNNPALTSQTTVYINVAKRPDFISDETCTVDMDSFTWDISKTKISNRVVQVFSCPIVGDLDGDGKNEVITTNHLNLTPTGFTQLGYCISDAVLIFDSELQLKNSIAVPPMDVYTIQGMAIADVDPVKNDGPELLIATGNHYSYWSAYYTPPVAGDPYKLYCYKYDSATNSYKIKWKSTDMYFTASRIAAFHDPHKANVSVTISVSDIDHDGLVEILVGERIFSGGDEDGDNGGRLLGTLPDISSMIVSPAVGLGRGWGTLGSMLYQYYAPLFADVDGDGVEEVVAGNAIYKAKVNHSNPSMGNVTTLRVMLGIYDGFTSVADLNGDGVLDIVTVGRSRLTLSDCYVCGWTVNGTALFTQTLLGGIGSRPFIGDINGNGIIDIALTTKLKIHAWEYNHSAGTFTKFIDEPTTDSSGATTMTLFDFDNNGSAELVYRDEDNLRIINKNGTDNIAIPVFSGTHTEYPVVVDVDGDGHAEIIVSGSSSKTDYTTNCRLQMFKSPTNSWAPARKVWHQHGYNPTMINEDLTVPRYPLNPATKVVRKDGSVHYPYNNFLQQVGYLNIEGDPLQTAPDLAFVSKNQRMTYNNLSDVMTVDAYVTNYGAEKFEDNLLVALYAYDSSTSTYKQIYTRTFATQTVSKLEEKTYTLTIPGFSGLVSAAETGGFTIDKWFLSINLKNNGASAPTPYNSQKECVSWNNLTSRISYVTGDLLLCEGETGTIKLQPSGIYDCYWFSVDAGGNKQPYPSAGSNKGDQMLYTKIDDSAREFLLIQVHSKGSPTPISNTLDSIFIYHPMDTLVWTGAVNADWHNVNNWRCPSDPTNVAKHRHLPRSCTNVLIPDELQGGGAVTIFPDLSATGTQYATYTDAQCNNISFEHGGEVRYVDHLSYAKAYVNVDMLSNRWYTFAPPLRSFYSGDIYKDDPNPFDDGMVAYTRLYSQPDPQHNSYVDGSWGRAFNTPTQTFSVGQGIGVWLDDFEPDETIKTTQSFLYPKHDADYSLYDNAPPHGVIDGPFAVADRTLSHKFIFEEKINASTKDVQLQVEATRAGQRILIANPYMAHVDFDKFYNYGNNKNLIEPHYTIMEDGYSYATYYLLTPGASTGVPVLNQYIAPMQAIIVEAKVPINPAVNPLVTNGSMTVNQPGASLRSAVEVTGADEFFKVSISDTRKRSKASLVLSDRAKDGLNFDKNTDVMKVVTHTDSINTDPDKAFPVIYFITNDSRYTDIKALKKIGELSIPIGIQFAATGPMALGFENISLFEGYYVYLEDKYEHTTVELSADNPIYCFYNQQKRAFVNDRFVLKVSKSPMGIEEEQSNESPLILRMDGNTLSLESKTGEALGQTIIYNMQGVLIFSANVPHSSVMMNLTPGIYILKNKSYTTKVISK